MQLKMPVKEHQITKKPEEHLETGNTEKTGNEGKQ